MDFVTISRSESTPRPRSCGSSWNWISPLVPKWFLTTFKASLRWFKLYVFVIFFFQTSQSVINKLCINLPARSRRCIITSPNEWSFADKEKSSTQIISDRFFSKSQESPNVKTNFWFCCNTKKKVERFYSGGFHIIWPDVLVSKATCKRIALLIKQKIVQQFGDTFHRNPIDEGKYFLCIGNPTSPPSIWYAHLQLYLIPAACRGSQGEFSSLSNLWTRGDRHSKQRYLSPRTWWKSVRSCRRFFFSFFAKSHFFVPVLNESGGRLSLEYDRLCSNAVDLFREASIRIERVAQAIPGFFRINLLKLSFYRSQLHPGGFVQHWYIWERN